MNVSAYYKSPDHAFTLLHGDSIELLNQFDFKFDMIFADPPYFLSNGGISMQGGRVVCVDKGDWDKGRTRDSINAFNREWLSTCRDKLKDNGTIWVSGTYHNIFSVATQHLVPLFHVFCRIHHLGKTLRQGTSLLQL